MTEQAVCSATRCRWLAAIAALLAAAATVLGAPADLEPIRSSYDAVPGRPLVLAVRPDEDRRPRDRVTLRFPDGREIEGDVAAVRLVAPEPAAAGWIRPGPGWRVLGPREVRSGFNELAWFILAELPEGVIGQEVWLDGRPIGLRWLPRPELLASRLGFPPGDDGAGPLEDPWASPLPEDWRTRPDLLTELEPVIEDPARRWRATLAVEGLHARPEEGVGPITPELLRSGLVEASARVAPLGERLLAAVAEMNEARWRVALARVWAIDPSLSLRVRHALAGAAEFKAGRLGRETVVAPAWTAGDAAAQALLEGMLDAGLSNRARETLAREWLAERPDAALWVVDDAPEQGQAVLGAMWLRAGDASAVVTGGPGGVGRPSLLVTRRMALLRAGVTELLPPGDDPGEPRVGVVRPRIGVTERSVAVKVGPARARPPGVRLGDWQRDRTLGSWLGLDSRPRLAPQPPERPSSTTGLVSFHPGAGDGSGWRVFLRLGGADRQSDETVRIWIGPHARPLGVITAGTAGRLDMQRFEPQGAGLGAPRLVGAEVAPDAAGGGGGIELEITIPEGAIDADGLLHLGLERIGADGARWAWPRAMLPWDTEPARRAIDTTGWMGELAP